MAKPQKKKSGLDSIELHPDAWDRFENFVKTKVPTRAPAPAKPTASRSKGASGKSSKKT
jgi:hypothetical protein